MELRYIPPEHLRAVWSRVRDGLEQVQASSPEPWLVEDVYHAIRAGAAQLFLAGPEAFVVSAVDVEPYSGQRVLHLWAGYSPPGTDVVDEAMTQLQRTARESGCAAIRFGSTRKGWAKRYRIHSITYEVPVE
jgi:hypothetical protein